MRAPRIPRALPPLGVEPNGTSGRIIAEKDMSQTRGPANPRLTGNHAQQRKPTPPASEADSANRDARTIGKEEGDSSRESCRFDRLRKVQLEPGR